MRDKIVRLTVTCQINYAASKNLQTLFIFRLPSFDSKLQYQALFYETLLKNLKDITAADKI